MNQTAKNAGLALMRQHALIAGEPIPANGSGIAVDDPATGEVIGHVPELGAAETDAAIQAAAEAFPDWSRGDPHRRAAFLRQWAALIDQNLEGLGALMALENGKPFEEAKGEVTYANGFIKWFAGEAERLIGETQDSPLGHLLLTYREAVGPCALITPWNFPAAMLTRKLGPAFAAGCTAVVKPASQTPFTAIALAELAYQAGLPVGALSIVTGEASVIGKVLTDSPLIRKLSFTGSTGVGRKLAEQCAPTLKRVSMELGGAAPLIVFADADLDLAAAETIKGKFRNSGQTCVCPNRVYVERSVAEAYAEKLAAEVAKIKVGAADRDPGRGRRPVPQGGDLRSDDPGLRLRHRDRGAGQGQRQRIRPGLLSVHPRPGSGHALQPPDRGGHVRGQHRPDLHRRRPVRRGQTVRLRPRGLDPRHRRICGCEDRDPGVEMRLRPAGPRA